MSENKYTKSPIKLKKTKLKFSLPKLSKSKFVIIISVLLLLGLVPSTMLFTLAYRTDTTGEIVNEFNPKEVKIEITEDFDGVNKNNVSIQNQGDLPAYVRFKISVSAIDEDNNTVLLPINTINTLEDNHSELTFRAIDINDFTIKETNWKDKFLYDEESEIFYCENLVPVDDVVNIFTHAEFNKKIFPSIVSDLPLPFENSNGDPYYVFNKANELCYQKDDNGNYIAYDLDGADANKGYTLLLKNGKIEYMLNTYMPVLTITAESIQANGVTEAWGMVVNNDNTISLPTT